MEASSLTKEQLDKLEEILPKNSFDILKHQFDNQLSFFPEETKLIDCPHEIIFSLGINVLEQDKEGYIVANREVSTKTYHIPVPTGIKYTEYVKTFTDFFEEAMVIAADKTDEKIHKPTEKEENINE
jgi:hypothetical protein